MKSFESFPNKIEDTKPNFFEQLRKKFGKDFIVAMAAIVSFTAISKEVEAQSVVDSTKNNIEAVKTSDTNLEEDFKREKEYMISWFSNRHIEDTDLQRKFEKERSDMIERLQDMTLSKTTETFGTAEWRNDTIFINPESYAKDENKTAIVHEASHDVFPANYGSIGEKFHRDMPKWMVSLIMDAVLKSGDEGLRDVDAFKKYYQRAEEVYARICAVRKLYNFKPNQIITKEDLQMLFSQNKSIEDSVDDNAAMLVKIISNQDILVDLFNKLP